MKNIEEYQKDVTVYLVQNYRSGNSLKIEFNPRTLNTSPIYHLLRKLQKCGFSCNEGKSVSNITDLPNIIDIALPLYISEKQVINDLVAELSLYMDKSQILDRTRTTIVKEGSKMRDEN